MASPIIYNGSYVKTLKNQLKLGDDANILTGTDDPTSVAKDGPRGSIYLQDTGSVGKAFIKQDDGITTNWLHVILNETSEFTWTIGDGANSILAGTRGRVVIPKTCTIVSWRLTEGSPNVVAGSIQIEMKKGADWGTSVSIAGSELPTLSTQSYNQDMNLTTWTTSLTAGDFLWFNVSSNTGCKKVTLVLEVVRS